MQLDTEVLKGALCELAKAGGHLDVAGQAAFAADVHAQLGRTEAVLKASGGVGWGGFQCASYTWPVLGVRPAGWNSDMWLCLPHSRGMRSLPSTCPPTSPPCPPPPPSLQVVGSPPEGLVDTFFELMPHGSPSDFQRMLDLKVGSRGLGGLNAECGKGEQG